MRSIFSWVFFVCAMFTSGCSLTRQESAVPSLEEMAGAMIMVGFQGTSAPPSLLKAVSEGHVGGIILFDKGKNAGERYNIESPAQVKALASSLQDASPRTLLIAVDQEGGKVCRLKTEYGWGCPS